MTEKKYDNLLRASFAVLAVSAVMLCISTYSLYFGKKSSELSTSLIRGKSPDSLQQLYSIALKRLDADFISARQNADTLSADLDIKLAEFTRLRNEITSILQAETSKPDYLLASKKIGELQSKVDALNHIKTDVEAENVRLRNILAQLSAGTDRRNQSTTGVQSVSVPAERLVSGGAVTASQMQLAIFASAGSRDKETDDAEEAQKISGSFSVRNLPATARAEIVVVVLQPDGKVVRNSVWETGMFETREGKKVYSRKIFYDPSSDNNALNFSLSPEKFWKGEYTLQVWYDGRMIGRMSKSLS